MRSRLALAVSVALLVALTPGCATAIASALGASGSSAQAAADIDSAMLSAAVDSLTSGGQRAATHAAPDATSFGGEPSYLCELPDDAPQLLAASSLEGATATCAAMNALPEGGACRCREAELGEALGEPIARQ